MQGLRALRVPIAACKINRNRKTDLAAAKDKVEERPSLLDLEGTQRTSVFRLHLALFVGDLESSLTRLQHGKSELDVPQVCVFATFLRLIEFDLKLSFNFCRIHRHTSLGPTVAVVPHSDQFRLVNWLPVGGTDPLQDDEKVLAAHSLQDGRHGKEHLARLTHFLLFADDPNRAAFTLSAVFVDERPFESLTDLSDHLM